MPFDRKLRRSTTGSASSSAHRAPGRSTLTSRHVMRSARDNDGVQPGAAGAVDQAASSSGAPLPGDLRGRFESSLGTDLSDVRTHTGDPSAAATEAVGARAYAEGQDIHFGAGQYDPSSASGQHLIAHEVAHTVQQRGGTAAPQYKLEVSSPGDASEVEADAAADAMVAGTSATVDGAGPAIMREQLKSTPPPLASDAEHFNRISADAHTISLAIGASPGPGLLRQAADALGQAKVGADTLAAIYGTAQTEVEQDAVTAKEAQVANQAAMHGIVKAAAGKAIGLIFPVETIAKQLGGQVGSFATKAASFLVEKAAGAATDAASDAVADAAVGKLGKVSDVVLPSNALLLEVASAKELWKLEGNVTATATSLASISKDAVPLVSEIQRQALAAQTGSSVPTNSSAGTLLKEKPASGASIEAMMGRLGQAKSAVDQATAAAQQLLAEARNMDAHLVALVAATTKQVAKSQIRAAAGIAEEETVSTGERINKSDITTQWNRMVGDTVTATTDCKPSGQCKPPYYPAKTDPAAPTPQVNVTVGENLGELVTGQRARVIAVLDAGWYSVTLLVQPIAGAAAPAWNGGECT